MKNIVCSILIMAVIATSVQAQTNVRGKGENCKNQQGCDFNLLCVEDACGCPFGKRLVHESHPDGMDVDICRNVVGLGCNKHEDCSVDLPYAKCNVTDIYNKRCICLKEDNCNGAVSLAVFSLISMLFTSIIVAKF